MPHIRLMGLVLFVTSIFIALAALATQTTAIRFKRPSTTASSSLNTDSSSMSAGPNSSNAVGSTDLPDSKEPVQFVSIPIIFPLIIAGASGLVLWFMPAALTPAQSRQKRRRRTRRRK